MAPLSWPLHRGCGADIRNMSGSQRALGPTWRTWGCGGWLIILQLYVAILIPLNPKFQSAFVLFGAIWGSHLGSSSGHHFPLLSPRKLPPTWIGVTPRPPKVQSWKDVPKGRVARLYLWEAPFHGFLALVPLFYCLWCGHSVPASDSHEPSGDGLDFQKSELSTEGDHSGQFTL